MLEFPLPTNIVYVVVLIKFVTCGINRFEACERLRGRQERRCDAADNVNKGPLNVATESWCCQREPVMSLGG